MAEINDNSPSLHLVDPELVDFIKLFPLNSINRDNLLAIREMWGEFFALADCPKDGPVTREERFITSTGPDGNSIRILIYSPSNPKNPNNQKLPIYVHIPGGGYILPGLEAIDERNLRFAEKHQCIVVSMSYRLAPENPFPCGIEDCYAVLKWAHDNADELSGDRGRIVIGGESAGGGLTAALALLTRDRGEIPLAGQILIYPMIDDRTGSTVPASPLTGEFIWTRESNRLGWESLLSTASPGTPDISPYAAAARAEDLSGLPPCTLIVGALDLFLKENIAYAQRLMLSGIPTDLQVFSGAYHGFELSGNHSRLSKKFYDAYDSALEQYFIHNQS